MNAIDNSNILVVDKRYIVQDVSKFPKDQKYMIGQPCILKRITGSTASVMFTGRLCTVPVRSLVHITGFFAKSVAIKNADGFVVTKQNTLGLAVGSAFFNHDKERSDSEYIFVNLNGKDIKVPFDILSSLVAVKKKEDTKGIERIAEKSGLSSDVVSALDEVLAPSENRREDLYVPDVVRKLLPGVNLVELRGKIRDEEGLYYDYEGGDHSTIEACDKANTRIRRNILESKLNSLVEFRLKEEWNKE